MLIIMYNVEEGELSLTPHVNKALKGKFDTLNTAENSILIRYTSSDTYNINRPTVITWDLFDVTPVVLRHFGADFLPLSPPERRVGSRRGWHQLMGISEI